MSEVDYSKLRGRIREKYGTESAFAEAMEMRATQLSLILNGKALWQQPDIKKACLLLDIGGDDIGLYFFAEKVS